MGRRRHATSRIEPTLDGLSSTKVTFEDNTYECTFEHLSQVGWEPNNPTMHSVWKLSQAT